MAVKNWKNTNMQSLRNFVRHPTISIAETCANLREIKQIHTQLVINGFVKNPDVISKFAASIALKHPHNLDYSAQILTHCENPTVFALNSMVRAYSKSSTPQKSFHFYKRLLHCNQLPDNYTFTFLVRTCAQLVAPEMGLAVHGTAIKLGLEKDPHVQSGLVNMYAELGLLGCSQVLFTEICEPDVVTQTAMVTACVRLGDIVFARELFDQMPKRDIVAWNAMIVGYVQFGQPLNALNLFDLMQMEGVMVNEASMVSLLSACTQLGALDQGRWAHAYIERERIAMTVMLGSALVDMYAKCGDVDKAMEVFWGMREKNVYTWSSAMGGLAMNGFAEKCLELFSQMKQEGVMPNEVTFTSVLKGCSVGGLVEEGCKNFESMRREYGIEPKLEHYGCMVDLYSRSGCLDEALDFINNMPLRPGVGAWGALLNACKIYKNVELGELASRKIVELEANNDGAYVLLSNIYADFKKWDSVNFVRQTMKDKGVVKVPGFSVVEVNGQVHEFIVGDKSHPRYPEIEMKLEEIYGRLKLSGYVSNTNPVLFDIEEEEKENTLSKHSEKVAIAFGLISLKEGLPIRILKNLRVCWDCHVVAELVSNFFEREIIMRDNNRFHHFKNGKCSCNNYW